jgi:hypothetical protein
MSFNGGCQCGRIRYQASGPRDRSSVCFCRMCQKASGAPFMAFVRFSAASVSWSTLPATFASSSKVERGFCPSCGTPLSYRQVDGPYISLALHSLDQPAAVEPSLTFAAEQKATWLDKLGALPNASMDFTSAPGFTNNQHPDSLER